tara:strand:+ start:2793 stop:3125 length:333 start_codon:yes stop_codon:yes gene_type:complete
MVKIEKDGFTFEYKKDYAGSYSGRITIHGVESFDIHMFNCEVRGWDNSFHSTNFGEQEDAVYSFADAKKTFMDYAEMFVERHRKGNATPLCEIPEEYWNPGNKCECSKCK